ncbi:transmembrane protein 121B-like [Anneissia japonica]|uniref:transmembrane protein 121B-like n=1 Tax=Anneissia japonica TaxID=1529436 RepID=UPI00142585B8|nr:transmembrane protein 121B-like [Anneissia japonica]
MSKYQKILETCAVIVCIFLLILQATLLNVFCIELCSDIYYNETSNETTWIPDPLQGKLWFIGDSVIAIVWCFGFYKAFGYFKTEVPHSKRDETDGIRVDWKKAVGLALKELPFAYVSWLLYASVMSMKIVIMFEKFAEKIQETTGFYSTTSLKISFSISGPIFVCLVYGHHRERNNDYKLLIDKLGLRSAFGILDSLILLNNLFVIQTRIVLSYPLDRTIKAFTCINYLLPVISLLLLRVLTQQKYKKFKNVNFVVIVSSIQTFLVDVPLFAIRLYLWFHHDVDVSIFITKNLMSFVNAGIETVGVITSLSGTREDEDECEMEALDTSTTVTGKAVPLSETPTLPI